MITLCLYLFISLLLSSNSTPVPESISPIIKSPLDTSIYTVDYINGFTVIYVENEQYTTASLALLFNVGYSQDPAEIQGLAHFVEHIMFISTSNDQNNNQFEAYVSQNGGYSNARTAEEYTVYYFKINSKLLLEAAERFTQFFISPAENITESAVDIAINEINAEFLNNKRSIDRRNGALLVDIMKDDTHVKRFGGGNSETLSILSRKEMVDAARDFISNNYRSAQGTVVICSNRGLDYMKNVGRLFEKIPRDLKISEGIKINTKANDLTQDDISNVTKALFKEEVVSKLIYYDNFSNNEFITIVTFISFPNKCQINGVLAYIKYMLLDQGECGLLARLKRECLASNIWVSFSCYERSVCVQICVSLMENANRKRVLSIVRKYLKCICANEKIYLKIKQNLALEYQYRHTPQSIEAAFEIALNSRLYDVENMLDANFVLGDFNAEAINKFISSISDENEWIVLVYGGKHNPQFTSVEKFYGVRYSVGEDCKSWLDFQVEDFEKIQDIDQVDINLPSLIHGKRKHTRQIYSYGEINFVFDSDFKIPGLFIEIALSSEDLRRDPVVYAVYFIMMLERFKEKYTKRIQDTNVSMSVMQLGYELVVTAYGFTEYVIEIVNLFFKSLKEEPDDTEILKRRFEIVRQGLINQYKSIILGTPCQRLTGIFSTRLLGESTAEDKLEKLMALKIEDLVFDKRFFIEMTGIGNASFSTVEDTFRSIQGCLDGPAKRPAIIVDNPLKIRFKTEDTDNNAVGIFYEINPYVHDPLFKTIIEVGDVKIPLNHSYNVNTATGVLIMMIARHKFFDDVRRSKKMGYIANCSILHIKSAEYLVFTVQSQLTSSKISEEILSCVEEIKEMIRSMDQLEFDTLKQTIADSYLNSPGNIIDLCTDVLLTRSRGIIDLEYNRYIGNLIINLTKSDVLNSKIWSSHVEVSSYSKIQSVTITNELGILVVTN